MDLMAEFPDKHFELAIVDPPYGIGVNNFNQGKNGKRTGDYERNYKKGKWDFKKPNYQYFDELFRVSKNQIIWGANYFTQYLPPSSGWVLWDKGQRLDQADGELAYTSFNKPLRIFLQNRVVLLQEGTIHPTQKPVKLYKWLLENYAKPGDKILDTHLGSGSIAIACHYMGFDLTGSELDEDYFTAMMKRIKEETAQVSMF